jgi:hypothetical protein
MHAMVMYDTHMSGLLYACACVLVIAYPRTSDRVSTHTHTHLHIAGTCMFLNSHIRVTWKHVYNISTLHAHTDVTCTCTCCNHVLVALSKQTVESAYVIVLHRKLAHITHANTQSIFLLTDKEYKHVRSVSTEWSGSLCCVLGAPTKTQTAALEERPLESGSVVVWLFTTRPPTWWYVCICGVMRVLHASGTCASVPSCACFMHQVRVHLWRHARASCIRYVCICAVMRVLHASDFSLQWT